MVSLSDFTIDTSGTAQDVQRRQKLADALMQQGSDSSPAAGGRNGGWITALNRGLAGALSGYQRGQADQISQGARQADQSLLASYPGMNGSSANPVASMGTVPAALTKSAPQADTSEKIYDQSQLNPMDEPRGDARTKYIATLLGEEKPGSPEGLGVANTIRNRAVDGGYGGDSPDAVVQAPSQYSPWNDAAGRARMARALQNPADVAKANDQIDQTYGVGKYAAAGPNDPTEGKTHFYDPASMVPANSVPKWAQGREGQKIGQTMFYDDPDSAPQNSQMAQGALPTQAQVAQAGPQVAQADPQAAHKQELLAWARNAAMSQNPQIRQMGIQELESLQKQESYAQETDKDGNVWSVNKQTGQRTVALKAENDPKWGIVGKDKYGQPTYGYPPTREEAAAKAQNAPPEQVQPDLTDVHGEDYMSNLKNSDPKMESQVRAIIEGRAPYPTGMLLKTTYGQELASHVTQADPAFESGNATARVKVRNEFKAGGVGSPAGQISAGNTALQHAGEMSDALERVKADSGVLSGVGSSNIPYISKWANELHNSSVQGTSAGAALNDFMTAKNHFSEEVTKFYAGSAGSEAERTRALANLDAAKSLPELRSAIKTEANLMQGKVNALQERWRNGMGPLVPDFPLISKESQAAVDRVLARDKSSATPDQSGIAASAPTAVDPGALAEAKRRGLIP